MADLGNPPESRDITPPPAPYSAAPVPYPSPPQMPYQQYGAPPVPYGVAVPVPVPFAVDPATGLAYSDKSKVVAGLLQLLLPFVGVLGVGRLYTGHIAIGLVQLIGHFVAWALFWVLFIFIIGFVFVPVAWALWLWSVIDGIVILASSSPRDAHGRVLRS